MYNINLPQNKHIGVMFSGGADSTLLLYLLHKQNIEENKNNKIIPYTIIRQRTGNIIHTNNILIYLKDYFKSKLPDPVYVGVENVHHTLIIRTGIYDARYIHSVDRLYFGDTCNPPEHMNANTEEPIRILLSNPMFFQPFIQTDKSQIIQTYFDNKIEKLLKLTHSCSRAKYGRCNGCFFCKERDWAFTKLGLEDPGNN